MIFDHCCGLDTYILNREPRPFEFLRCLVDAAHYRGHVGCPRGYDSQAYKPYMPPHFSTQGREQIHAKLEKLKSSFRQMNYTSFMIMHKVFFGIQNLKNNGVIS